MRRRTRIATITVLVVLAGVVILGGANAGPSDVAPPGLKEAEELLDCAQDEGVFSFETLWSEGSAFASPDEALRAILVGSDFAFTDDDFIGRDVDVAGGTVKEYVVQLGGSDTAVVWVLPSGKGWLADSVYGCTKLAD